MCLPPRDHSVFLTLQGRHADRLFTVCYLPVNLAVLLLVVRHHTRVRPLLRIVGGFVGFTLAVSAVPLVSLGGTAPTPHISWPSWDC